MGCNTGAKGSSAAKHGGGKAKSGKGGGQVAMGSNKADGQVRELAKHTAANENKFRMLEVTLDKLLAGSTPRKSDKDKYWTWQRCGRDKCFSNKDVCYKRSKPKAPTRSGALQRPGSPQSCSGRLFSRPGGGGWSWRRGRTRHGREA